MNTTGTRDFATASRSTRGWPLTCRTLGLLAMLLGLVMLGGRVHGFEGVATNVPVSALSGWTECYRDTYASSTLLPVVLDQCRKANLMLACRPVGAAVLTVAAHAPRDDVLFLIDHRTDPPHVANGVAWYYEEQWSWGFAPPNVPLARNSCDTLGSSIDGFAGPDPDKRLCWHTQASFLAPGWRCGRNDFLNADTSFERVILEADVVPPDSARCGNGVVDPGEECDDGGLCTGGTNAGATCAAESGCAGNGVCEGGTKLGTACANDSECPGSQCVHCKTAGGDGCAANCTLEHDVVLSLVPGAVTESDLTPGTSGMRLLSQATGRLPLPLSGAQILTIGAERNGRIPAVIRASTVQPSRLEAGELGCACLRAVDARTCGGTLYDTDGTPSTDCTADYTPGTSVCPADKPCAPVHGPGNTAAGIVGCGGLTPVNANVTQDCNGTPDGPPGDRSTALSGVGPAGSALLVGTFALGANGVCPTEFCSDADPQVIRGTPVTVPLTTGNVAATIANADDSPGLSVGPIQGSGVPLSCSDLAAGKTEGAVLVSAFTSCDEPGGQDTAGVTRLVGGPLTPPRCGNERIEFGEECDDGGTCIGGSHAGQACDADADCDLNEPGVCTAGTRIGAVCSSDTDCPGASCTRCRPFGGDGCAANCTLETEVAYDLITGSLSNGTITPGTSGATVYGEIIPQLPLLLRGTQTLTIGKERDGQIPLVIKAASVSIPQIPVATIACACVRAVAVKTCGGTLFEADGVTRSTDCTDGFTDGASTCPADRPCAPVHGAGNSASGLIGCAGLAGTDASMTQDCNGEAGSAPLQPLFGLSGSGPAGSALVLNSIAIGTQVGACTASFCTDNDAPAARGNPITVPFTTGAATALVQNANDFTGLEIGPHSVSGAPFSCAALAAALPNVEGAILAGAFTSCDQPTIADVVVTTTLAGARPAGPPPTSTPTATRTATPTLTPTPTPAVELRVNQTTLTPGQRGVPLSILLSNSVNVRAVQFSLTDMPDGITLRAAAPCLVASRAAALSCSANQVGNEIRVVLLASGAGSIAPGEGQILTLFVDDIAPVCAIGTAVQLILSQTAIGGDDGMALQHAAGNATLFCDCKGDIDASRTTDIFDALACIDFILERRTPDAIQQAVSDVTCDSEIDIFDCIGIVDVILGLRSACPLCQ